MSCLESRVVRKFESHLRLEGHMTISVVYKVGQAASCDTSRDLKCNKGACCFRSSNPQTDYNNASSNMDSLKEALSE
jgi:hypothetical protein